MAKEETEVTHEKALKNRKEYILRANHEHIGVDADGDPVNYTGGDKVLLTDDQYKSFADKFETAEDKDARIKLQAEARAANEKLAEVTAALQEQGLTLDDLIRGGALETLKKPDKTAPQVGADNADVRGNTVIPEAKPENALVADPNKKPDGDEAATAPSGTPAKPAPVKTK